MAGVDLVRDGAGRWAVLQDNLRAPAGIGYAIANRWLSARILPDLVLGSRASAPARAIRVLRYALTTASPALALVTAGPSDAAFYEHRLLAGEMGIPLVCPADLRAAATVCGSRARSRTRVEVLYRRMDEDELFAATGADGSPLGPGWRAAIRKRALVHGERTGKRRRRGLEPVRLSPRS